MKRLLTLAAAGLITIGAMAADRFPSVTIKSKKDFEIVVDGRTYRNDNNIRLDRLRKGMHTIKVYERTRGLFGSRTRLVSSKNFMVRNDDLRITVDRSGYVDIDEQGYGRNNDRNDRGWGDNDRDRNRDWDKDRDKDWDRNGNGSGRNRGY
jgi:hypothetical protein